MPPVNQAVVAASVGFVVVSVAITAAIAAYESPEVRRAAENIRRRVAIALHALGDNFDPNSHRDDDLNNGEPRFNRPEDAQGFRMSRGTPADGADPGVDADEESRRRQREELMYWNAMRESNMRSSGHITQPDLCEKREDLKQGGLRSGIASSQMRPTFDDFLTQDQSADRGTYVFNTGAQLGDDDHTQHLRRRGPVSAPQVPRGISGLNASAVYANPFSDEHGVDWDDKVELEQETMLAPDKDEVSSQDTDIYGASPRQHMSEVSRPISLVSVPPMAEPVREAAAPATHDVLFDRDDALESLQSSENTQREEPAAEKEKVAASHVSPPSTPTMVSVRSATLPASEHPDRSLEQETVAEGKAKNAVAAANTQDGDGNSYGAYDQDAHASIHAWAQGSSNPSFYSPLPVTPSAPMSEAEVISQGQLTPTDSMSGVDAPGGSEGVVVGHDDAASSRLDVLSESEGAPTPASWSEVGSVVSENDVVSHR